MATPSHQNPLEHTATANDPAISSLLRHDDSDRARQELQRIAEARHHDPFAVLGKHACGDDDEQVCVYMPGALTVALLDGTVPMQRTDGSDFFTWRGARGTLPARYRLHWQRGDGRVGSGYDPYNFPPQLADFDILLFNEGRHWHAYRFLGAHPHRADGVSGVLFATWAPNAARVSVVGDFNGWDGRRHPMRVRGGSGVWELFIPELPPGTLYKFELRHRDSGSLHLKADPYGQQFEVRPSTASIVRDEAPYVWQDHGWLQARSARDWRHAPLSIYEVHLGSWQRDDRGGILYYRERALRLVDYVKPLGFTHIELLPVTEHPLDASWGYQTIGNYAATSRFGTPDDFRYLVDYCHRHDIGVLLDWVPGHFPKDPHGLARFDGSALYEHEDPRRGEHRDWGTLIYNYGRSEVKNYLLSSAVFWLEEFHLDGLRVDALSGLFAPGRRLVAQRSRRQRKPRGHRLPAPAQRSHPRPISGHDDHGRGIHVMAHGVAPRLSRRSWLQHEVEHGMDARQPALYAEGRGAPPLSPRLAHVRFGVLLLGKFHPAFFPRRGGARQGRLARPHAGGRVATLRQSATAVHLHVYVSGQKTIIHGRRIRSGARVEFRCDARLALA